MNFNDITCPVCLEPKKGDELDSCKLCGMIICANCWYRKWGRCEEHEWPGDRLPESEIASKFQLRDARGIQVELPTPSIKEK